MISGWCFTAGSKLFTFHYVYIYIGFLARLLYDFPIYIPLCLYLYIGANTLPEPVSTFTFHYVYIYIIKTPNLNNRNLIYIPLCLYLYGFGRGFRQ